MKIVTIEGFMAEVDDFTGICQWEDGTQFWYKNGKMHRTDGPAAECANGYVGYYINDEKTSKQAVELFNWLFPDQDK